MHDREMTHILLITVQYTVKWYRPETVNIPNISCIILEYTIALITICMNLCYVGNLLEDGNSLQFKLRTQGNRDL